MASTYLEIEQEDGSFLKFKKERIKARWVKEVFKLEKKLTELGKTGEYDKALDLRIEFAVKLFGDPKLTKDVIYDGVDSDKIVSALDKLSHDIVGNTEETTGKS